MIMKATAGFILFILQPIFANAKLIVPDCDSSNFERPTRLESPALAAIGSKYLVARKSLHSLEKEGRPLVQVEHSFATGKASLRCSQFMNEINLGSSIYVPTLINFTKDKKYKNSYWQFQMNLSQGEIGIWNRKSRIASRDQKTLQAVVEDQGLKIQIVKLNQRSVDLLFLRGRESLVESVLVTFDIVDRI